MRLLPRRAQLHRAQPGLHVMKGLAIAIALALKSDAPIFVENQVLDKFGTKGAG